MHDKSAETILGRTHPYDALPEDARQALSSVSEIRKIASNSAIYKLGRPVEALCLIIEGQVKISNSDGEILSILGPGNSFGERGLLRDGIAPVDATASEETTLLTIPAAAFHELIASNATARQFFDRTSPVAGKRRDLSSVAVGDLMTADPLTCSADTSVGRAAQLMSEIPVSCIIVIETNGEALAGILTTGDLTARVVARGRGSDTPVREVMTPNPVSLPPSAPVADVLQVMTEHGFTHLPVIEAGRLVGILTQTDLTRFQATNSASLLKDVVRAPDAAAIAKATRQLPQLLVQLVASENAHQTVTRLITDIADGATRRLLSLAEARFGPAPVPYLWLACGSQGRQEQTGVSDQDNCMILSNEVKSADHEYFEQLARFVCDGLNDAGYVYCPGEMMATNPRWRQSAEVWESYFTGWIDKPDPEAQMLASVMFDLRPIGGDMELFAGLQERTLAAANRNSIFVAHMAANSLKHTPPLSLFRGLATVRSGDHKDALDLKHKGVVPVIDLARLYAMKAEVPQVNSRARLLGAVEHGALSRSGGQDLIHAYDLIAELRLKHQAEQIKRGEAPDNFMLPAKLSDFERSHLRDAFVVVKTIQSAVGSSGAYLN